MSVAEGLARAFHESYGRLAPEHGYAPPESAVPWEDLPEVSRGLMVAVAADVLERLLGALAAPEPEPVEGLLPTECTCGVPRYRKTAKGGFLPPSRSEMTYVEPHPRAGGVAALACGNPRCVHYEPVPRRLA